MAPTIQQLERAVAEATDHRAEIDAMIALARSLSSGETRRGVGIALEAADMAERVAYPQGRVRAQVRAAVCLEMLGDYEQALDILALALDTALDLPDPLDAVPVYKHLGLIEARRSRYEEAILHFDRGSRRAEGRSDELVADLTTCYALVYRRTGQLAEALDRYRTALAIFEGTENRVGISMMLTNMGNVHGELGEYASALDCFYRSHALAEETGDPRATESSLQGIGIVYYHVGDDANALDYLGRAFRLSESLGHREMAASSANNLGLVYLRMRHYASALKYYMLSLTIRQASGDIRGESCVLTNIGEFYEGINDFEQAAEYHGRALTLRRGLLHRPGEAETLQLLGRVLLRAGDMERSIASLRESLEIAQQTTPRNPRFELAIRTLLVEALDRAGDREEAARYRKGMQDLEKEVSRLTGERDVREMITQFETTQLLRTAQGLSGGEQQRATEAIRKATELASSRIEQATPPQDRTPEVVVTTLGRFSVTVHGRELRQDDWKRKRARDVFKILLIHHGRAVGADELLDLLQGERGEVPSRATLWNAISSIKNAFEPELPARGASRFLRVADGTYILDLGSDAEIDFIIFRRTIEQGRSAASPGERMMLLEKGVNLYNGEFLKEDLYERWAGEMRQSLQTACIDALMELAIGAFENEESGRGVGFARRVLDIDHTYEEAYRILMGHFRRSGLESEEEKLRRRCHEEFMRETGAPPPPWLLRLMESPDDIAVSSR